MAGASIDQILGTSTLSSLVQEVVNGVPENILPAGFVTPSQTTRGNTAKYWRVSGTKKTARLVQYGGPSVRADLPGVSEEAVVLIHSYEHISLPAAHLVAMGGSGDDIARQLASQYVGRAVQDFGQRFKNLRVSSVYSLFSKGAIYFDGHGNLLPSSSGAVVTVDFAIPAANKNQLGGIISADWDEAATDIASQIEALKEASRRTTGYELEYAFYGAAIFQYLLANTQVKALLANSPSDSAAVARNSIPAGFLGIANWVPINQAYFSDATGTAQDWFADDQVVFTPAPSQDWFEFFEGTYSIPTSLMIGADLQTVLGSMKEVAGPFSYAAVSMDPPGGTQWGGDTFLPVCKVPGAIYIADVKAT